MTTNNDRHDVEPEAIPDDLDRALTTAADVESAGRSCLVIVALAVVILVLLAVWVLYTMA
jgi:hypothetical protein